MKVLDDGFASHRIIRDKHRPQAEIILLHGVGIHIPIVEISNQRSMEGTWGVVPEPPAPNFVVSVQSHELVTLGELIQTYARVEEHRAGRCCTCWHIPTACRRSTGICIGKGGFGGRWDGVCQRGSMCLSFSKPIMLFPEGHFFDLRQISAEAVVPAVGAQIGLDMWECGSRMRS